MASGNKVVAVIGRVDGKEPDIQISDQNFKVIKTKEGITCIVHKKTEGYYAVD